MTGSASSLSGAGSLDSYLASSSRPSSHFSSSSSIALIPVFLFLTAASFLGFAAAFLAGFAAFGFLEGFSVYDFFIGAFGGADNSKSAFAFWYHSLSASA